MKNWNLTIMMAALLSVYCSADTARWSGEQSIHWHEGANWNQATVPDNNTRVWIDMRHYGSSIRRVHIGPQQSAMYKELRLSSAYDPQQQVMLTAHAANIFGGHSIIGDEDNIGLTTVHLEKKSKMQDMHPNGHLRIAKNGSGFFLLSSQSYLQTDTLSMGENYDSFGNVLLKDPGTHLVANRAHIGLAGEGHLWIQHGAEATIHENVHMATGNPLLDLMFFLQPIVPTKKTLGKITVEHAGSSLHIEDTLFLAKKGTDNIRIQDQAKMTVENIVDPAEPSVLAEKHPNHRVSHVLLLERGGHLKVINLLQFGQNSSSILTVKNNSQLETNLFILDGGFKADANTVLIEDSQLVAQKMLLQSVRGPVQAFVANHGFLKVQHLSVGEIGLEGAILKLAYNSSFEGHSATVGNYGVGELSLHDNSHFYVHQNLHIASQCGSTGTVRLSSTGAPSEKGSRLYAQNIIMEHPTQAKIVVKNYDSDQTPMHIRAPISGEGIIEKQGSGTLEINGHLNWQGRMNIMEGNVILVQNSYLNGASHIDIADGARLALGNSIHMVKNIHNQGHIDFYAPQHHALLHIQENLEGNGTYHMGADFTNQWSDSIFIANRVSGEHGLHFRIQKDPSAASSVDRLLVAKANRMQVEDRLFYLIAEQTDALGPYEDIGLLRYDLRLHKEEEAAGAAWYLECTARTVSNSLVAELNRLHLSDLAQISIETAKATRRQENIVSQGVLRPSLHQAEPTSLIPLISYSDLSPYQTRNHLDETYKTFGLSYAFSSPSSTYTLDLFHIQPLQSASLAHLDERLETQALRVKWQHASGWQSFLGIEKSRMPFQNQSVPKDYTSHHHIGTAFYWNPHPQWAHGPEVQFGWWNQRPSKIGQDPAHDSHIYAAATHTKDWQLGWQMLYQLPAEKNYAPFTLQAGAFWKKHQEQLRLSTNYQSVDVPLHFKRYEAYAQAVWKPSGQSEWRLTAENQGISDQRRHWGMLLQWGYQF